MQKVIITGIKEWCDVIVQPTTGGGKGMTLEERAAVLPELEPEMATFDASVVQDAGRAEQLVDRNP